MGYWQMTAISSLVITSDFKVTYFLGSIWPMTGKYPASLIPFKTIIGFPGRIWWGLSLNCIEGNFSTCRQSAFLHFLTKFVPSILLLPAISLCTACDSVSDSVSREPNLSQFTMRTYRIRRHIFIFPLCISNQVFKFRFYKTLICACCSKSQFLLFFNSFSTE